MSNTLNDRDLAKTEAAIGIVDGTIVFVLQHPGRDAEAVTLTPREADRLAGRLRKAASDLRASQARQGHGVALVEARRV